MEVLCLKFLEWGSPVIHLTYCLLCIDGYVHEKTFGEAFCTVGRRRLTNNSNDNDNNEQDHDDNDDNVHSVCLHLCQPPGESILCTVPSSFLPPRSLTALGELLCWLLFFRHLAMHVRTD